METLSLDDMLVMDFDALRGAIAGPVRPIASPRNYGPAPGARSASAQYAVQLTLPPSTTGEPQEASYSYESLLQLDEGNRRRGLTARRPLPPCRVLPDSSTPQAAEVRQLDHRMASPADARASLSAPCTICREPYAAGAAVLRLPCKHAYHEACGKKWLAAARTCPDCRLELFAAKGQA